MKKKSCRNGEQNEKKKYMYKIFCTIKEEQLTNITMEI